MEVFNDFYSPERAHFKNSSCLKVMKMSLVNSTFPHTANTYSKFTYNPLLRGVN